MDLIKRSIVIWLIGIVFTLKICGQVRHEIVLDKNWKFTRENHTNAYQEEFDDSLWKSITIPHDWAIYGPFNKEIDKQTVAISQNEEKEKTEKTGRTGALPYIGEGWYRRTFKIPKGSKSRKVLLAFDGAMSQPKIYINGKKIGEWNYGYNYFYFDISSDINFDDENLIAVHLKNDAKSSRWYPGAGLYRNVKLIVKNPKNFKHWGTFVTTPKVSKKLATVEVKTEISTKNIKLISTIIDSSGNEIVQNSIITKAKTTLQTLHIEMPKLWSPESPNLYFLKQQLFDGTKLQDEIVTRFGVRTIKITPNVGFSLNGKIRKFKGVCLHHDLGPLGTAINTSALRRQLTILKDLGVDAIRSSHNMPAIEQLNLCDEMGFMFLAESFDEWKKPKVENGYHRFFEEDVEKDIVNLVRATRNHPSIVMWSSGNEVLDQNEKKGAILAKKLQDIFHREDPTRAVTVGMDQVKSVMKSGFGNVLDVPGLNYRVHLYEEAYKTFPQGIILGSETASTVSSRGIYKFPVKEAKMKQYDDLQCSSYDLESCSWSNIPDKDFMLQDDKPWVIGEFVWTGFDYLGEPTPYDTKWPSRSSYFGILDLAGLPKDRYYLYRSRWNTRETTLHLLPHWNWKGREGKVTPVFVYTNYDRAELFLNGKSLGIQSKYQSSPLHRYRLMWMDVKYEPGTLKVVALDSSNNTIETKEVKTAGKPHKILLNADRTVLKANGKDLSYVEVTVVDKENIPCPTATNELSFEVNGAGIFRAACNGDATSLEAFHKPKMSLFSGKLIAIVQSKEMAGNINLTVKGEGLESAKISFISIANDNSSGILSSDI